MKRADIVSVAREFIDVPFFDHGRNMLGVDCVGIVACVGDRYGIPYEDVQGYSRSQNSIKFLRHLRKYLNPAPIDGNKTGMVGVFRQHIYSNHVGIFVEKNGRPYVINARFDRGRVVEEEYTNADFHLVELLAFPGLED